MRERRQRRRSASARGQRRAADRAPRWAARTRRISQTAADPPPSPTAAPTTICSANSPPTDADAPPAGRAAARASSADHQRDADRVVGAGLALEDRAGCGRAISRPPSTENTTAGSVGASAVPSSSADAPAEAEQHVRQHGHRAAVTSVPDHPDHSTGAGAGRSLRHPDVHAAVEQDQHQRHRDDPLAPHDRQVRPATGTRSDAAAAPPGRSRAPGSAAAPRSGRTTARSSPPARPTTAGVRTHRCCRLSARCLPSLRPPLTVHPCHRDGWSSGPRERSQRRRQARLHRHIDAKSGPVESTASASGVNRLTQMRRRPLITDTHAPRTGRAR